MVVSVCIGEIFGEVLGGGVFGGGVFGGGVFGGGVFGRALFIWREERSWMSSW